MDTTRGQLGERLRAARIERGLTQAEVARALELRRPAISEIEAARRSVSSEELRVFSRLYGVPVTALLGEQSGDVEAEIALMARIIAERFRPERIILFGSHARGSPGPDSDVDLLVIMDVEGSTRRKAVEIGAALHHVRLPKDVIVTTPEQFAWRREVVGTIERPAAREGRVVYERR